MAELVAVMEGDHHDKVFVDLEVVAQLSPPEYASTDAMLMSQASNIPLLTLSTGVGDTRPPPHRPRGGSSGSSRGSRLARPGSREAGADGEEADSISMLTTLPAWRQILSNWRLAVIVLTPIVLLPLLFVEKAVKPAKAAYVVILMAVYWCTEVLPLAATSLIPIFLVPMLGLMKSADVCMNYLKDLNFLFVGGLMFAVAVEKWNLHKRLALRVVMIVGTKPGMLMFGFLSVTGFLSMWLSNTAATAMMIPIAESVLKEMWISHKKHADRLRKGEESDEGNHDLANIDVKHDRDNKYDLRNADPYFRELCKALSLSICIGSNIGGTATLTGTGPNLVIGEVMLEYFPESNDISFGSWMVFAVPLMILALILAWIILQVLFLGPRSLVSCFSKKRQSHVSEETEKEAREIIRDEYYSLGSLSSAEISLIVYFFILVLLWLFRDPKMFEGWHLLFKKGYVTDASVGIFVCLFLFAFPSSFPCTRSPSQAAGQRSYKLGPPLLDWHSVQQKLPWGVIILLGGGFAMADVCKDSGLSDWLGCQLAGMKDVSPVALCFAATVLMSFLTQFTSNTSSANILLPIIAELAIIIRVHPVYLMVPVTMASSYSFIFPISTPPNAIVFSYGHLKVVDMAKSGAILTVGCILLVSLAINTWGSAYWHLDEFPNWAMATTNSSSNSCH